MKVFTREQWQQRSLAHYDRVYAFAQEARKRAARREKHPIYDFLTKYYPFSLGKFEKWHPGYGVTLEGGDSERFVEPRYTFTSSGACTLNPLALTDKERVRYQFILNLLEQTQQQSPVYSCFGLHEWAMVYSGAEVRHRESAPFRLPQQEIDSIVESRSLVCTHFDAFRFFAPKAQTMNKHILNLDDREAFEQPACIHANMDLYKWSFKLYPWIGSDFIWRCFQLALTAREIDMRASPYDLSEWEYEPICIETDEGRKVYLAAQKALETEGKCLREELISQILEFLPKTSSL